MQANNGSELTYKLEGAIADGVYTVTMNDRSDGKKGCVWSGHAPAGTCPYRKLHPAGVRRRNRTMLPPMADVFKLICWTVIGLFRSRASLEAEILTLHQQLNVLRRKSPKRLAFSNVDRLIFAGLYQITPRVLNALTIVEPETVIRWHRAGFRLFWRWKSRCRCGRPKVSREIRQLIRDMSLANPLWGAPRIHGELPKLGIDVGAKRRSPNIWRGAGDLPRKAGRRSSAIMPMGSHQLTCLSFRQSHFGCFMAC